MNQGWLQNITILRQQERPLQFVPWHVWLVFFTGFLLQILWHGYQTELVTKVKKLPSPPTQSIVTLASLDDPITAGKLIMLWLQAFDNQPGISIPIKELNYDLVIAWLNLIMKLDPGGQYPLLMASRFYTYVPEVERKQQMLEFVQNKFLQRPHERWQWMAHAIYVAKHRIKDMQYALVLAKSLRENTTSQDAPVWARQMEIFILEDMGELESAMIIIGGLLESGELKDPQQRKFLQQRLQEIEKHQHQEPDFSD